MLFQMWYPFSHKGCDGGAPPGGGMPPGAGMPPGGGMAPGTGGMPPALPPAVLAGGAAAPGTQILR